MSKPLHTASTSITEGCPRALPRSAQAPLPSPDQSSKCQDWPALQVIQQRGLWEWLAAVDDFRNWLVREAA